MFGVGWSVVRATQDNFGAEDDSDKGNGLKKKKNTLKVCEVLSVKLPDE